MATTTHTHTQSPKTQKKTSCSSSAFSHPSTHVGYLTRPFYESWLQLLFTHGVVKDVPLEAFPHSIMAATTITAEQQGLGRGNNWWAAHMIVKTLGSACLPAPSLKFAGRRQIKCAHAHTMSAHLLSCSIKYFSPCPLGDLLKKTFHACIGSSYLSSLSLKQHIRMKHVRSANWVAPKTCPRDVSSLFFSFWSGEPIAWHKHAPKGCFLSFWRGGGLISHQVPKHRWAWRWTVRHVRDSNQSAKQSAAVRGQARRAATVASRRLPSVAEHKVEIFCLSGFVEDRGQICFWRSSQSATLHPSCARPMRNAITCLTEINQNQQLCVPADYYSFF